MRMLAVQVHWSLYGIRFRGGGREGGVGRGELGGVRGGALGGGLAGVGGLLGIGGPLGADLWGLSQNTYFPYYWPCRAHSSFCIGAQRRG